MPPASRRAVPGRPPDRPGRGHDRGRPAGPVGDPRLRAGVLEVRGPIRPACLVPYRVPGGGRRARRQDRGLPRDLYGRLSLPRRGGSGGRGRGRCRCRDRGGGGPVRALRRADRPVVRASASGEPPLRRTAAALLVAAALPTLPGPAAARSVGPEPIYRVVVSVRTSAAAVRIAAVRPATLIRAEARPARGDRAAELRGFGRGPLVLIRRAGAARATAPPPPTGAPPPPCSTGPPSRPSPRASTGSSCRGGAATRVGPPTRRPWSLGSRRASRSRCISRCSARRSGARPT